MNLEDQIEKLASLGINLNKGITIDDLLLSWSREDYENKPFDLILFAYGSEVEVEPWGRYFCDQAWNFDLECIEDHGDYSAIVKNFHRITGESKKLTNLSDIVDLEAEKASLTYTINGAKKELEIVVDDDWADPKTVKIIMDDLREDGFDYYGKDNGQATVWFYLTPENANMLNEMAGNVFDLAKKPRWKLW